MGALATILNLASREDFSFDEVFRYYRFNGCCTMIECFEWAFDPYNKD